MNLRQKWITQLFTISSIVLLSACGGGSGSGGNVVLPPVDPPISGPDYSRALLLPVETDAAFRDHIVAGLEQWGGLTANSADTQEIVVRRGPIATLNSQVSVLSADAAAVTTAVAEASSVSGGITAFTGTNVLVAGVDELDLVKYDGEYIYAANHDRLNILKTGAGAAEIVSNLDLSQEGQYQYYNSITGLYHHKTTSQSVLTAIRGNGSFYGWFDTFFAPWFWREDTSLELIDVSDPSAPAVTERIDIDGNYVNSRQVGDVLYLVTRYTPGIDNYIAYASSDDDKDHNRDVLAQLGAEDILPVVTFMDGSSELLINSEDCLLPRQEDDGDDLIYPTLTTITAIDLNNPRSLTSVCLTEGIWGMHMSLEALYVAAQENMLDDEDNWSYRTKIHKFALGNGAPEYVGSGRVPGTFWGDPTFLMGEHEGRLSLITTEATNDQDDWFEHRLSILAETDQDFVLEVSGQIPNDTRPESIGKPNEQIFASRIFGDRAYVVTFEQVDPVYVIDLADPADPVILGELEIPGFSTYLHPVSNDLVLGVGRDIETVDGFPLMQGVNVRLFDVSDPGDLQVLEEFSIGRRGTHSDALWDSHAFTFLAMGDNQYRFAIPISVTGTHQPDVVKQTPWDYYSWSETALYLFEIDGIGSDAAMFNTGKVVAENLDTGQRYQPNCCAWNDRSFINGDRIHYLSKTRLFSADYAAPEAAENVFVPTLVEDGTAENCTTEAIDGLWVSLSDRDTQQYLNCVSAIATDGEFSAELRSNCNDPEEANRGVFERAGSYSVTVNKDGYLPWTTDDVVVQRDDCHVGTTYVYGSLKKAPQ